MFTHQRPGVDLNGTWKFCPDPMQRCRRQQWWRNPPQPDRFFPCWDMEGLWDIRVPGTWKTQFESLAWYDGHAVYVRDFEAPEVPPGHETFLVFDGAVYAAEVYLNGHFAGRHDWGYSPFRIRTTGMLQPRNRLFVLVDSHLSPARVPGEVFDWNNDGGLIGEVKLIVTPPTFVENFRTATRLEGGEAVIAVDVFLRSRDPRAREAVTVRLPELGLEQTVEASAGGTERATFRVPRERIDLWAPERPRLYRTEVATAAETLADDIGYREVRTEGRRILLNGEPIRLYGISVHAEFKDTGRAATAEGVALMIERARELGVNFLRCAHYPYAERFGRALDRAGLLWWEEVPAYWLLNMREPAQTEKACGMLRETIVRDWNRASLIIWSVSNECCHANPDRPEDNNYPYWFAAVPLVRELDPSRLVSCAEAGNFVAAKPIWDPGQADEFRRRKEDAPYWRPGHRDDWYALLDVLAANFYPQDREEMEVVFRRFVELMRPYNKPLMLSEFGGQSLRGAAVDDATLGGEGRHERVLRDAYEVLAELPEISATSPWCLVDVRVPIHWRWYNAGRAVFRYGFCDERWERKRAFFAVRDAIAGLRRKLGPG